MPHLASLVERGVMGNIATLYPPLSPMLWTSIATGKRPFKHGIYGFSEPTPDGMGIRPVSSLSRNTRALWNMLHLEGKKSNVIGWWPSHPAEPINGVMVSDMFQKHSGRLNKDEGSKAEARRIAGEELPEKQTRCWPLPPHSVHPEHLREPIGKLRLHPQELTGEILLPFIPKLGEIDQSKDHRVEMVAKILCECTSIHAAATAAMQLEPWDLMAVYYDSIDHFSHGFMQFHPPRLPWVNKRDFELYQNVVETGYCYHDMMLGTLLELAGSDTTVMLLSDHGFYSDNKRPRQVANEPAGPAEEHSHYGIFVMAGPEVKQDERIYGACLLDITPTLLHAMHLPVGEDMDGKVLINAFSSNRPIEMIPSWDERDGEDGAHDPSAQQDPIAAKEALDQLVELGYIEPPDENIDVAVKRTTRELRYNLARSHIDAGMYAHAADILEDLQEEFPSESRFMLRLIACRIQLNQLDELEEMIDAVEAIKAKNVINAQQEIEEKFGDFSNKEGVIDTKKLSKEQQKQLRNLSVETRTNPYAIHILRASVYVAQNRRKEAKEQYAIALKMGAGRLVMEDAADNLAELGEDMNALAVAQQALDQDPKSARALLIQAKVHEQRKHLDLAEHLTAQSIGLLYHNAEAHFRRGKILSKQGRALHAAEELKICLKQAPTYLPAIDLLIKIYSNVLKNLKEVDRLQEQRKLAEKELEALKAGKFEIHTPRSEASRSLSSSEGETAEAPLPTVDLKKSTIIVSGLPRSGTSMIMQMLDASNYPLFVDRKRIADENNPRGYFEHQATLSLHKDNRWIEEANGHAVKVVAPLLSNLTTNQNYRIIFIERNLDEIVKSQTKMREQLGHPEKERDPERLKQHYKKQLNRVKRIIQGNRIPALFIQHRDCILNPASVARQLNEFMDDTLNEAAMTKTVDPALYRNRSS